MNFDRKKKLLCSAFFSKVIINKETITLKESSLQHSNLVLAEIRLKTVERAQLNFHNRFWSNIVQVDRNSTHGVGFLCADLGEIQIVGKISVCFGVSSSKISGGN
jgi:hypothetical protein